MGRRDVTQRRLGLHADEVDVVVDREHRLRGVGHLPDDDRGDLDRVAVGVVDLQVVGLEVPDPDAHGSAGRASGRIHHRPVRRTVPT